MKLMSRKMKNVRVKLVLNMEESMSQKLAKLQESTPADCVCVEDVVADFVVRLIQKHGADSSGG